VFPQKNRVRTEEFMTVMKTGSRTSSENISVVFIKNKSYFKGSVVVSKKISKLAPNRNSEKRKVREAVKKVFSFTLPYSIIFFVKKPIRNISFDNLLEEIKVISKKIL